MLQDMILQFSEHISVHERVQMNVAGVTEAGDDSLRRSAEVHIAI